MYPKLGSLPTSGLMSSLSVFIDVCKHEKAQKFIVYGVKRAWLLLAMREASRRRDKDPLRLCTARRVLAGDQLQRLNSRAGWPLVKLATVIYLLFGGTNSSIASGGKVEISRTRIIEKLASRLREMYFNF